MRTDDATIACQTLFEGGALTLGLMTPAARKPGQYADVATELAVARRADRFGFAALWAAQAPVADAAETMLDDPFVWLAALGAAAPSATLVAQPDWSRPDRPQLVQAARSLQRMVRGRCALAVAGSDAVDVGGLLAEAGSGSGTTQGVPHIPLLHVGDATGRHPVVRQLYLELDEHAHAPPQLSGQQCRHDEHAHAPLRLTGQYCELGEYSLALQLPAGQHWRGGRIALLAALERLADDGVAHVVLHLVRNGRPALDIIDELGTEVMPRLAASLSARCGDVGEAR